MAIDVLESTVDQIVTDYGVMVQEIPLGSLFIDVRFQRELSQKRAEDIAGNFDAMKFGVLLVNRRALGGYSVTDGQHRYAAAKIIGITSIACQVIAVTAEREAVLFVEIQHLRKDVKGFERHRAMVTAKIEQATQIDRIMRSEGFKIGSSQRTPGVTNAARAVHLAAFGVKSVVFPLTGGFGEFFTDGDPEALKAAFHTIRQSWGIDGGSRSRSSVFIGAITYLFHNYADKIDHQNFYDALANHTPDWWHDAASGRRQLETGGAEVLLARSIVVEYNKRFYGRSYHRIDPKTIGRYKRNSAQ